MIDLESGTVFSADVANYVLVYVDGTVKISPADAPFSKDSFSQAATEMPLSTWAGSALEFPGVAIQQLRERAPQSVTAIDRADGGTTYSIELPGQPRIQVEFDTAGVPIRVDRWQGESHDTWDHLPKKFWPLNGGNQSVVTRLEYIENASVDDFTFLERMADKFKQDFEQNFLAGTLVTLDDGSGIPQENETVESSALWLALVIVGVIVCALAVVAIFKNR